MLAGVAAWLAVAWWVARPDSQTARVGLGLAALVALTTLGAGLIGALGFADSLPRAARAALLVLVATWLRGAAGPEGMRDVFRAVLGRLRRFGWTRESAALLDRLDSAPRLTAAGRELVDALRDVPKRPSRDGRGSGSRNRPGPGSGPGPDTSRRDSARRGARPHARGPSQASARPRRGSSSRRRRAGSHSGIQA